MITYVKAREVRKVRSETTDKNKVVLGGTLSQAPKFWKFQTGRRRVNFNLWTSDLKDGVTSLIPCVARNRMADVLCELPQWEELSFEGSLQGKEYIRTFSSGEKERENVFEAVVVKLI